MGAVGWIFVSLGEVCVWEAAELLLAAVEIICVRNLMEWFWEWFLGGDLALDTHTVLGAANLTPPEQHISVSASAGK